MASAQDDEPPEIYSKLVHSDLPLFGLDWPDRWPVNFSDGEGDDWSFGCLSRVRFGDWKYREVGDEGQVNWYRFTHYGVLHCFANLHVADDRIDLNRGEFSQGLFFKLATTRSGTTRKELWVFQRGGRPGSDYVLLMRDPGDDAVARFDVLQSECPRESVRESRNLDILSTRYCAINSRAALIGLMKRMAKRPPLATLTFVGAQDEKGPETGE